MNKSNDEPKVTHPLPGEVKFEWDDGFKTHYYHNPGIKDITNKPEWKKMYNEAVMAHSMWLKYGPEGG